VLGLFASALAPLLERVHPVVLREDGELVECDDLERARLHDHREPAYLDAKDRVADAHYALGLAARDEGNWEEAYARFSNTLRADPWRSWARRYAEEMRAIRLGIDPASLAEKEAERLERQRKAREARDRANLERKQKQSKKPDRRK
jgi:hypothetical protein